MSKSTPLPIGVELVPEVVLPHPVTASSQNTKIEICGKEYDFSQEMLVKYPKLLDPSMRYTVGFEAVLPLIYDYPPSCIPPSLIDEAHEKSLFLSNCEFLGIKLSDDVILHLNKETKKKILECAEHIAEVSGRKGRNKMRFSLKKEVSKWCRSLEQGMSEIYEALKPIEIVQMLEEGSIDELVLHDFRYKNCVNHFINLFREKFLSS